jgi:hypothetical protein
VFIENIYNMEGTSGVSIFRKEVRSFYVGCLTYIKKKFPLNDAIIKHAVLIDLAGSLSFCIDDQNRSIRSPIS